jgi:hypothetical protein
MGTGEGAQAYGYGAYLAESPDVAKPYAPRDITFENKVMQLYKQAEKSGDYDSMSVYENYLIQKQPEEILAQINDVESGISDSQKKKMLSAYKKAEALYQNQKGTGLYQTRLAWPDAAREATDPLSPENFLDWDKPLIEQSPMVQEAIGRFEGAVGVNESKIQRPYQVTGSSLYDSYFLSTGADPARLAKELNKAGIPGIRYLDAGSRGASEGSRNYVVFDDKLIDIVSRNNQPIRKAEAPQANPQSEYRISHRPMTIEGGSSTLDNLIPSFGDDIYTTKALQFFGSGDKREKDVIRLLVSLKGNPNKEVTIYRGVPSNAEKINYGDWVTLSKDAAQDYANAFPGGKVISQNVPASHVTAWPDSLLEQGYYPPNK